MRFARAVGVHRMSDYGLKVWDASGNVTLDTTDSITRLRYSNEVAADASSSVTLSDISGLDSVEISVCLEQAYGKCPHLASRSGTTLSWTAQSGAYYTSAASLIFLFLYS